MRIQSLFILVLVCTTIEGITQSSVAESLKNHKVAILVESLAKAGEDSLKIAEFFKDWNQSLGPNELSAVRRNKSLAAVYDLYRILFQPFNLSSIGEVNDQNYPNFNKPFIAVQNHLRYLLLPDVAMKDSSFFGSEDLRTTDTILDFRPPVDVDRNRVLYLAHEYRFAIDSFLGAVPPKKLREMFLTRTEEAFAIYRSRFISIARFLPIDYQFSGFCVPSAPQVEKIILSQSLTKAVVIFTLWGGGSRAYFRRTNGKWTFIHSESAWYD